MRRLRILHISDLHERAAFDKMPKSREPTLYSDAIQRGHVLGERFVEELEKQGHRGIDLVCFTGDLADWGHPAEYLKATQRMDAILDAVQVPRGRFFAVPGNHDVQRAVNEPAWRGIRKWLGESGDAAMLGRWLLGVGQAPSGTKLAWITEVLERTAAFWSWFESYRGSALSNRQSIRVGYRETFPAGTFDGIDATIHLVGLDSAWLCGADESRRGVVLKDQGSIVLTDAQVDAHTRIGERGLDGFRIGLVHHPLDHLADHLAVRRLLGDGALDLLLHGHQHTPMAVQINEPGSSLRILAAGCLMEGDFGKHWPNEFHVVEVDPTSGAGEVEFRKWSPAGRVWAKGSDIYKQAPDGVLGWNAQGVELRVAVGTPGSGSSAARPPVSPPPAAQTVVLKMLSVRLVDTAGIAKVIQQYKRRWPTVTIEWPPSLSALVDGLKQALEGDLTGLGAEDFAAGVPPAIQHAERERARVAELIPGLVERARELSDDQLAQVLGNLLLIAAYHAHRELVFYTRWEGLRPWQAPKEWIPVRGDSDRRVFASLMGEVVRSGKLPSGRLSTAEGIDLYDHRGSPGLYVLAPERVLRHPDKADICQWFIPQLEYGWPSDDLPPVYRLAGWHVDKLASE